MNSTEIDITMDEVQEELKLWEFTLMGNVLGAKPTLKTITNFVEKHWSKIAKPIVQYYKKGWFSFRFSTQEEMDNVLKGGPWGLGSNSIILKQWSPSFSFVMEKIYVVPIWILFPDLEPYLWSDSVLSKLATKVGKLMFADLTTTCKAKLSFARVLVDADVATDLPEYIILNTPFGQTTQIVIYEWLTFYCYECGKLGHKTEKCKLKQTASKEIGPSKVAKPANPSSPPPPRVPSTAAYGGSECHLLGGTSTPGKVNSEVQNVQKGSGKGKGGSKIAKKRDSWADDVVLQHEDDTSIATVNSYEVLANAEVIGEPVTAYGSNDAEVRHNLWDSLVYYSHSVIEWVILWEFNVVRTVDERITNTPPTIADILNFNTCISQCGLDDMRSIGCEFAWTNNQEPDTRVWTKLDRAMKDELSTLKQREKVEGILNNDRSTRCFFARIQERKHAQIIRELNDAHGVRQYVDVAPLNKDFIATGATLTQDSWDPLIKPITKEEIKTALFDIDSNKSPGPDVFSSGFFKTSWSIIEADFCKAILDFFHTGKMLKQANSTLLALIPKKKVVQSVQDFRPISCCTTIYKTIAKILTTIMKIVMPSLVGAEQAAFVQDRNIFENIMLSQALVKGYDRKHISPRSLIKVDIKKAFNTL
ncbi:uncharacterized protein LOC141651394 [Silene latifolia]|uniref:uncharacterized protein LOC141651394 n=1 Tax=Silene latifolia TaxID=37657 RepID=UPI003D773FCE